MGKPTICIGENKGADQPCSNCEADHAFVFATGIVQFIYFLNPKFPASNHLLCLYSPVCVGPGWNPNCWFSHTQALIIFSRLIVFNLWKIFDKVCCLIYIYEPHHEKMGLLPMQKQRRRSASQLPVPLFSLHG